MRPTSHSEFETHVLNLLVSRLQKDYLKVQHQVLLDVTLVVEDVPEASGDDGHDLGQVVQARIGDESDIGTVNRCYILLHWKITLNNLFRNEQFFLDIILLKEY